ncbi:MAG: phytanoyl-CoA dioxygenase family protein [Acidobacteria bacterium]|nr:phytanoyl-CoA dioxygenase family protein [Acidobacteriota bacterium]
MDACPSQGAGLRFPETKFASIASFLDNPDLCHLADQLLGTTTLLARTLLFDKNQNTNWHVPWHQDLQIAVKPKEISQDWSAASLKQGRNHAQPPLNIQTQRVHLRFHLDPAGPQEGCLQVLPGSHKQGVFSSPRIPEFANDRSPTFLSGAFATLWAFHPLLLHRSSRSKQPNHKRRVLQLEFVTRQLKSQQP